MCGLVVVNGFNFAVSAVAAGSPREGKKGPQGGVDIGRVLARGVLPLEEASADHVRL